MYGDRSAGAGRLVTVHSFHRRVVALVVTASMSMLWACNNNGNDGSDDASIRTVEETLVPPEATLPGGKVTAEYVVDRMLQAVSGGVGFVFSDETDACVRAALLQTVSDADLAAIGVDGLLAEQPILVQDAIFAAFDGCISGDLMASVGAAPLINAGATPTQAECVLQLARDRLGFAGLYRYGATGAGEAEPNALLTAAMTGVYDDCGLDPESLVAVTSPPVTRPTTTLLGATTTAVPPTNPGETTTTALLTTTTGPPVTLTRASTIPDPSSTTLFPPRTIVTTALGATSTSQSG